MYCGVAKSLKCNIFNEMVVCFVKATRKLLIIAGKQMSPGQKCNTSLESATSLESVTSFNVAAVKISI